MTELPPDRYGLSDEQEIEVEEWTTDLGERHEIAPDDPAEHESMDQRLREELPDRPERGSRERFQLTDDGLVETDEDLPAEERAMRVDDEDLPAEERGMRVDDEP
ncbi:hypothetical protein [Nonomuraea soli]|uniref:DUF5709 domain-containing protein n=1 Tax=Nonomuraea soli TaxID=1032476 RepID=A0A7W0CSI4_9ACTN|nr:hypothetical protein [Nonomuraea soli]MBA2896526.1 hypothetical protein [Nonomuraea soli]